MDSTEVRHQWETRSGEYSPEYYAHYGPDETSEAVCDTLGRCIDRDGSILELGCSSGRHLSYLREQGFEDLTGVELNGDAFDVMAEVYPDLAASGTFYHDAIEDVVRGFDDDRFDAVYSVETLQHIHPDADWVFEELVRITDGLLITVENENEGKLTGGSDGDVNYVTDDVPLYYRDWNRVFTELGFTEIEATVGKRDTMRAFRST